MKRNFRVGVRYTFEGAYTVRAVSDKEAARLVLRRCGLTCGDIHTTLDELTCPDWDFPIKRRTDRDAGAEGLKLSIRTNL